MIELAIAVTERNGMMRFALSDADRVRSLSLMEAGVSVRIDDMGNGIR